MAHDQDWRGRSEEEERFGGRNWDRGFARGSEPGRGREDYGSSREFGGRGYEGQGRGFEGGRGYESYRGFPEGRFESGQSELFGGRHPQGFAGGPGMGSFGQEGFGGYPGTYGSSAGFGSPQYQGSRAPFGERGYGTTGGSAPGGYGQGWSAGQSRYGQGSSGWGRGAWGSPSYQGGYGPPDDREQRSFGDWSQTGESGRGMGIGPFVGRGPKGYRRSDERIREDVSDRLEQHPHIDATEIEVQVRDGVVTLTGTVDERHVKRMTEDVCESVPGVKDVVNHLRVSPAGHSMNRGESTASRESGSMSSGATGSTGASSRTRS
jgi:osmotically-inducible protein OsmY